MTRKELKLQVSACLNYTDTPNNSAYSQLRRLMMDAGVPQAHNLMNDIADDIEERITEFITQQIIQEND